jgi:hypothetical protein
MPEYQLPPLKDERQFEYFICDLFNELEKTGPIQNTEFQHFGIKGQAQKGIDIFSLKTRTAIQCKLKDIRKKDEVIRKSLIDDIQSDLEKTSSLQFKIEKLIFVSTFRDDSSIQEYVSHFQQENALKFNLCYWGWDTLSKYAEQYETIIKKYFPKFAPKPTPKPKIELPDGSLGKDLLRKNYINYLSKRYGDWKQAQFNHEGKGETFNWASHNKSLMNRYHASGINYIHVGHFDDLVKYLSDKIDKTIIGRGRKSKGMKNYSSYEEHTNGILTD